MSDEVDKNLKVDDEMENLEEIENLKMTNKEVLSVFKVEMEKYEELMKFYQIEKDYKAEIEKVLKELEDISGELDASDIQQEKDFMVERIRIWQERMNKVENRLGELSDEIEKSLVGKWLESAEEELEGTKKIPTIKDETKTKKEIINKSDEEILAKTEKIEKFVQPAEQVVSAVQETKKQKSPEFSFDYNIGALKLPDGMSVDMVPAKGHCDLKFSTENKDKLIGFVIHGSKPDKIIKIKVTADSTVKILEVEGRAEQVLTFNKPAEAKSFIERFVRYHVVAPEAKLEPIQSKTVPEIKKEIITEKPAETIKAKIEKPAIKPREKKLKPVTPKTDGKILTWQEQLEAARQKISTIPTELSVIQPPAKTEEKVDLPSIVKEEVKVSAPVISKEAEKSKEVITEKPDEKHIEEVSLKSEVSENKEILEEIEIPKNVDIASIAKFFHERQDDTAWNNYDGIALDLEQLDKKDKNSKRDIVSRTIKMLEQRLTVALTLKNSSDTQRSRKWRVEEKIVGLYKEFLQKLLEELPEEKEINLEEIKQETEIKEPVVEIIEPVAESFVEDGSIEINVDDEILAECQERNKLIEELKNQLTEVRKNLVTALANRERAGGVFGTIKTWLGSTREEVAEIEYDNIWAVYERVQKELLSASELQAESLKKFLDNESKNLQKKLGEHYKSKENIVAKVWKRLGEMNLYNYLEKKNKEVLSKEKSGEIVRGWDKFWSNRGAELSQSGLWAKLGAKALSVRLGISLGLLGVGLYEVPGLVSSHVYIGARTAFVGTGSIFGSRAAADTLQNIGQRWLGKRGEIFSSCDEAELVWRNRLGLAEEATGGDLELPSGGESDAKTEKRHKKLEKAMEKVEATISLIMDLQPEDRLKEIQHRIAAIEAYAYVNGFDLNKDENYQRLTHFRDQIIQEILKSKAVEIGDARDIIRPDSLVDALAYLESRKQELDILGGKITGEKQLRWGKRIVSSVIGVAGGCLAYLNMLGKAAAIETEHHTVGGKIIDGGAVTGEPKTVTDELVDKYNYPAEGMAESTQEQIKALLNGWEQRGLSAGAIGCVVENGLTEGEIADINRLLSGVAGHREVLASISRILEGGADSSKVLKSMLVQTARGSNNIEGLLQKQLKIDPEAYGYNPKNGLSVDKWADHQASVLTHEQHLDDKYFVFNKNRDQFVILRPDGKIELVGKTYVMEHADIEPIKVVSEHEMDIETIDKYFKAEASGDTAVTESMLDDYAKHLTDQEKVWLDKHWQTNEIGEKFLSKDDMNTLQEIQSRGHVFEDVNTGKQYHADQLDIADERSVDVVGEGRIEEQLDTVSTIKSNKITEQPIAAADVVDKKGNILTSETQTEDNLATPAFGPSHPEYIFKKGDLSVNLNFEYGIGGKVIGYNGDFRGFSDSQAYNNFYRTDYIRQAEDIRPLLRAKNLMLSKDGEIFNDLKNNGLSNSGEAEFLKEKIRRTLENLAQIKNTQVHNLFKQDKLVEFGFEEKK
ncbi:MAG: hypothetical protein COU29_00895 [Candidatus Magasanikbacteria bacterium CG10_big_fil_rev_8_21_14_0_10_36_32]|uniref:Uncharacterized protein n=1 Tax=Candidatus Magasanikbacteria bacterium CG10_big_fil_rev_8_21_14_0_10_36_32 TaxID=1974646 RepID=A0A2M6W6D3_9BACT|nr:MAG: hypothetical protein COU29_00895 [Candidatus Magasanikbacteria bacterium CG10_big_fil_rev_8_21_14_0_10_36_32]